MMYTFRFREHHNHWVSAGALDEKYIVLRQKNIFSLLCIVRRCEHNETMECILVEWLGDHSQTDIT